MQYVEKLKKVLAVQFNWPEGKAIDTGSKFELPDGSKTAVYGGLKTGAPHFALGGAVGYNGSWVVLSRDGSLTVLTNAAFQDSFAPVETKPE